MYPKVSFITGVKNRAKELKEMLTSLLSQDISDWEAIIVDDHSEEPLEETVKQFNDKRFSYFKLPEGEKGICHARNLAVSKARAELMLTADGDDISRPQRARVTYEIMSANSCDAFYSHLEYFNDKTGKRSIPIFQPFEENLFKMYNFMTNPGTAFRKKIFLEVGGFDPNFKLSEDYDLWLRLLNAGARFCYTEEILVEYRRSQESTSVKKYHELHKYIQMARVKNKIPVFDIEDVKKYALLETSKNILTEGGRLLWQDDRYEK